MNMQDEQTQADYKQTDWQGQLKHKHSFTGHAEKKIDSIRRKGKKRYAKWGIAFGISVGALIGYLVYLFTAPPPTIPLTVNVDSDTAYTITVEIADTAKRRAVGLSGRQSLPQDAGMLFMWPDQPDQQRLFWMAGTAVPLSVAFIDATGTITQIEDMEPFTETKYISLLPVKYALETNQGWFTSRGIRPGHTITLGDEK
jgi:uncharacterized membrane protein (UPF0127 family)